MSSLKTMELKEFPTSHKRLSGSPYFIGDEYELLEIVKEEKSQTYIKVKRIRDGYIEVLSDKYFKNK